MICGKAWSNLQALRAHLKVHKGAGYVRSSFYAERGLNEKFKDMCHRHNTTTCQVLNVLMKAAVKGEELGVIDLAAPNPVVVHMHQHFIGVPRSRAKREISPAEYKQRVSSPGAMVPQKATLIKPPGPRWAQTPEEALANIDRSEREYRARRKRSAP